METEMESDVGAGSSRLAWLIDEHPIVLATVIYAILAAPMYYWLTGFIGIDGEIEQELAIISLAIGGLMFVPGIMVWLRRKKFELGFGKAQEVMRDTTFSGLEQQNHYRGQGK